MKVVILAGGYGSRLSETKQLGAYKHSGFWRAMDTLHDKNELTQIWMKGLDVAVDLRKDSPAPDKPAWWGSLVLGEKRKSVDKTS